MRALDNRGTTADCSIPIRYRNQSSQSDLDKKLFHVRFSGLEPLSDRPLRLLHQHALRLAGCAKRIVVPGPWWRNLLAAPRAIFLGSGELPHPQEAPKGLCRAPKTEAE